MRIVNPASGKVSPENVEIEHIIEVLEPKIENISVACARKLYFTFKDSVTANLSAYKVHDLNARYAITNMREYGVSIADKQQAFNLIDEIRDLGRPSENGWNAILKLLFMRSKYTED